MSEEEQGDRDHWVIVQIPEKYIELVKEGWHGPCLKNPVYNLDPPVYALKTEIYEWCADNLSKYFALDVSMTCAGKCEGMMVFEDPNEAAVFKMVWA